MHDHVSLGIFNIFIGAVNFFLYFRPLRPGWWRWVHLVVAGICIGAGSRVLIGRWL